METKIECIKSAAVFVGSDGIGPWQHMEIEVLLRNFVEEGRPVIPVLLANAPSRPKLPPFLANLAWVDFSRKEPEPVQRLIWGITGERGPL